MSNSLLSYVLALEEVFFITTVIFITVHIHSLFWSLSLFLCPLCHGFSVNIGQTIQFHTFPPSYIVHRTFNLEF